MTPVTDKQLPKCSAALARIGQLSPSLTLTLCGIVFALIASQGGNLSLSDLTDDAGVSRGGTWFAGAFSTLGLIILAFATATVTFAVRVRKQLLITRRRQSACFWIAVSTGLLLADDAFMLHDGVLAEVLHVPESLTQVLIGSIIAFVLFMFRKAVGNSFIFAVPALLCWSISVLADSLLNDRLFAVLLLEDGCKLLGICCWYQFCRDMAQRSIVEMFE